MSLTGFRTRSGSGKNLALKICLGVMAMSKALRHKDDIELPSRAC